MKDKHAAEIHCPPASLGDLFKGCGILECAYQRSVCCLLYFHVTFSRDSINDGLNLSPSSPEKNQLCKYSRRGGEGERGREKGGGRDRLTANSFLMRKP